MNSKAHTSGVCAPVLYMQYTSAQVTLKLAKLRAEQRVWIVNDWIINVDGVFVPSVEAGLAAVPPVMPDFPTVQSVCHLVHASVVEMVMQAPMAAVHPRRSDRACFGKVNNKAVRLDITLHDCGTRIKTLQMEYVLDREPGVVISSPYEILHSAMLAEDKSLRAKMNTLIAHGRALCIDNIVVNIDGVYVPQLLQGLECGAGIVSVASLPTREEVVEKGVYPVIAALIVAAPSTPAPWAYHAHNGVVYGKNVQVCAEPGVGILTFGKFLLTGYVKFERNNNATTLGAAVGASAVAGVAAASAEPLPIVAPSAVSFAPFVGLMAAADGLVAPVVAPPVQQVMTQQVDEAVVHRKLMTHMDDIASFVSLLGGFADGIAAFRHRKN